MAQGRDGERSVHLDSKFVRHLIRRQDDLPLATTVATLPVVLDDGTILATNGLDREHGTVFRIPAELLTLVQRRSRPDRLEGTETIGFLIDHWLVDVTADYTGKCILVACALTVIERLLLPERPEFFVTAGMRDGGKTTTLNMVSLAVLGQCGRRPPGRQTRRSDVLAGGHCVAGLDNITKGTALACPHIEKSLTAETFADRMLGEPRSATPSASTVQAFTGNNYRAEGRFTSRSLQVRLPVSRPDPENRDFVHPDPIGWTLANRGKILAALFTILLGNPRRQQPANERTPAPTRFKPWWEMVGSAVEHAAVEHKRMVDAQTPEQGRRAGAASGVEGSKEALSESL